MSKKGPLGAVHSISGNHRHGDDGQTPPCVHTRGQSHTVLFFPTKGQLVKMRSILRRSLTVSLSLLNSNIVRHP